MPAARWARWSWPAWRASRVSRLAARALHVRRGSCPALHAPIDATPRNKASRGSAQLPTTRAEQRAPSWTAPTCAGVTARGRSRSGGDTYAGAIGRLQRLKEGVDALPAGELREARALLHRRLAGLFPPAPRVTFGAI